MELLGREIGVEVRVALRGMLRRVGDVKLGLLGMAKDVTPTSPTSTMGGLMGRRRSSRQR